MSVPVTLNAYVPSKLNKVSTSIVYTHIAEEDVAVIGVETKTPPSISTVGVASIALLKVAVTKTLSPMIKLLSISSSVKTTVGGELIIASSATLLSNSSNSSIIDAA